MSKPEMTAQQPKKGAAKSFFKRSNTELSIFLLIVLLFVLFSFFTKNFFSWYNIHNLFKQSVVIGIISIALSFVFVTGRTDLSVGTTAGLSAMIVALLMSKLGMNPWLAIIIAVGLSTLCGLFNGIIIYDLKVVPFIATMGTSGVVRGLIKYMSNAMTIGNLDPGFNQFALTKFLGVSSLIYFWFVIVAIAFFVMKFTKFGRNLYVLGSSDEVANLSGINTRRHVYMAYIISAFLSAVAGILMTSRLNCAVPTGGTGFEMNAIASAVIGGVSMSGATGTPFGAALGTFLIMLIQNGGIQLGIDPFIMESVSGLMVIVAVCFNGFRERSAAKVKS
ncbi:ABC transporter permease [Feifania hominis]|uniref:ABC transporter permease n=1 Tax=Feifania hominis TaxID=2763660 RepID=A0A926DDK4_9FIRM|nr:ABC transporter permease [Feifania hominis]MBC8535364.1 ABC transporter permease [Feifania hominis]